MRAPRTVKPALQLPHPNPSCPNCRDPCQPKCRGGTARPRPFPAPSSLRRPFPVRPLGNKELGRGGRLRLMIAETLSDQRGKKIPLHQIRPQEGGGALLFCEERCYRSHSEIFLP